MNAADTHPVRDIKTRRSLIRWILFLVFVHTVPLPWIYLVIAGMAPAGVILAAGLTGVFWITEASSSLALLALAPALLYCLMLYGAAHLLALLLARLASRALSTGLVILLVAPLLVAAFLPIYPSSGHSSTYTESITGFWALTRLPVVVFHVYTAAFLGLLGVLLLQLYRGVPWPRTGLRRFASTMAGKSAMLVSGVLLMAGFLYVNHVLLICRPLAELGVARAQMCMGRALQGSVERNGLWGEDDARDWYERAARQNHAGAARALSGMVGPGSERQRWLEVAAGNGDRDAQYELYHHLRHVERTAAGRVQALRWLQAAAEKGDTRAQYELGEIYRRGGEGGLIARDPAQARHWLEQAAAQGDLNALWEVAGYYEYGRAGFPLDLDRASHFFRRYAEYATEGEAEIAAEIAANRNPAARIAAIEALSEGIRNNQPEALKILAFRYLEAGDADTGAHAAGLDLLQRAADAGDGAAAYELGMIYLYGRYRIAKDTNRGKAAWLQAAELHHLQAMERVARGYSSGHYGFEVDYLRAIPLIEALIAAYREGRYGAEIDPGELRRWEGERKYIERAIERAGGVYQDAAGLRARAATGEAQAQYQLGRQLFAENQIRNGGEVLDLYTRAAENGHTLAQMELFGLYRRGMSHTSTATPGAPPVVTIPKDEVQAAHYLEMAAAGRHPQAMMELALAYSQGRYGLPRDLTRARDLHLEIIHAIENDLDGWEVEERVLRMQRNQLDYINRTLTSEQERQQRYAQATALERRIMDIEDEYRREYQRRANAVCRGDYRCSSEEIKAQRKRIRLEIQAAREQRIAELKQQAGAAD